MLSTMLYQTSDKIWYLRPLPRGEYYIAVILQHLWVTCDAPEQPDKVGGKGFVELLVDLLEQWAKVV